MAFEFVVVSVYVTIWSGMTRLGLTLSVFACVISGSTICTLVVFEVRVCAPMTGSVHVVVAVFVTPVPAVRTFAATSAMRAMNVMTIVVSPPLAV